MAYKSKKDAAIAKHVAEIQAFFSTLPADSILVDWFVALRSELAVDIIYTYRYIQQQLRDEAKMSQYTPYDLLLLMEKGLQICTKLNLGMLQPVSAFTPDSADDEYDSASLIPDAIGEEVSNVIMSIIGAAVERREHNNVIGVGSRVAHGMPPSDLVDEGTRGEVIETVRQGDLFTIDESPIKKEKRIKNGRSRFVKIRKAP